MTVQKADRLEDRTRTADGSPEPLVIQSRARHRGAFRFLRNRSARYGAIFVAIIVALSIAAPWLTPYEPATLSTGDPLTGPSTAHWFGTDELGRDTFTRAAYAGRIALLVALSASIIAALIGVPIGLATGYYGSWTDSIVMRITDAWMAFPVIVLALAVSATLGPSLTNVIIAIGVISIPNFVRLSRALSLTLKERQFVEAARAIGQSDLRILVRHLLPNMVSVLTVQLSLTAAYAILAESALSFLGVGVTPPTPSWGAMLSNAQSFLTRVPSLAIAPGTLIFMLVLGLNLLGDGLRDVIDPRLRGEQ